MTPNLAATVPLVLAACLAGAATAHAQHAEPVAVGAGRAVTPEQLKAVAKAASAVRRHADARDWPALARAARTLLDAPAGAFLEERGDGPAGFFVHRRCPQNFVNDLLATLPPAALKAHEDLLGKPARAVLDAVREIKVDDFLAQAVRRQALTELARRRLATEAGFDALTLLADGAAYEGDHPRAAACYQRLLRHPLAPRLSHGALYRAAVAARLTAPADEAVALRHLETTFGKGPFKFDGRELTLERLGRELSRVPPAPSAPDWLTSRGNATLLTGHLDDHTGPRKPWKLSTALDPDRDVGGKEVLAWLDAARKAGGPHLPGFVPLATADLAVYRTHRGLTAVRRADLVAPDGKVKERAGSVAWRSTDFDGALGTLLTNPRARPDVLRRLETVYRPNGLLHLPFANTLTGTLSTDGCLVWAVDDLAAPPPSAPPKGNRLVAFDLDTGKMALRLGADEGDPFRGAWFLGPPVFLGGVMHVPFETADGVLRLVRIRPREDGVRWRIGGGRVELEGSVRAAQILPPVVPLGTTAEPERFANDLVRRTGAVHLAYGGGVIVFPTHAGTVLGIDAATGDLAWSYTYRPARPARKPGDPVAAKRHWEFAAPAVAGDRVVFTAADDWGVHCLELRDGKPLWRAPGGDLYFAGVFVERVLLVGAKSCRALSLATGKELWKVDTGTPAGLGAAIANFYYLPLQSGEVAVVDLVRGKVGTRVAPRDGEFVGNLAFAPGGMLTQTASDAGSAPTALPHDLPTAAAQPALTWSNPPAFRLGAGAATADDVTRVRTAAESARRHAEAKAWPAAAKAVQALLDAPESAFLEERYPESIPTHVIRRGPHTVAAALLREFPPLQVALEELEGKAARALLDEARTKDDAAAQEAVARRYLHTRAGSEAQALVAARHFKDGDHVRAALAYRRLLEKPPPVTPPAQALYQVAAACRRAGDDATAALAWGLLRAVHAKATLDVGGRKRSIEEARKEWEKITPLPSSTDWLAGRNLTAAPKLPDALRPEWRRPTVQDKNDESGDVDRGQQAKGWLDQALAPRVGLRALDALPGSVPLVVADKVIYRTYNGLVSVNLTDQKDEGGKITVKRGGIEWKSTDFDGALANLLEDPTSRPTIDAWVLGPYTRCNLLHLLYANSAAALATDGELVYTIDDLAVPPPPAYLAAEVWNSPKVAEKLKPLVRGNSLQGFEVENGKIAFRLGDPTGRDVDRFSGGHFLGVPLILGRTLYCLHEKLDGDLHLLTVALRKVRDSYVAEASWPPLTLGKVAAHERVTEDLARRTNTVRLAYRDGILVCPTHAGTVVGVDLAAGRVAWAYTYRPARPAPGRGGPKLGDPVRASKEWAYAAPTLADGKVVFTAPDDGAVHCLDLRDGRPLWRAQGDDDAYMAGVYGNRVVVVGGGHCRALGLGDGKQLWKVATGAPAGLGLGAGDRYYLPLRSSEKGRPAELCVLDLAAGRVLARVGLADESAGSVAFGAGRLVLQGPVGVSGYAGALASGK